MLYDDWLSNQWMRGAIQLRIISWELTQNNNIIYIFSKKLTLFLLNKYDHSAFSFHAALFTGMEPLCWSITWFMISLQLITTETIYFSVKQLKVEMSIFWHDFPRDFATVCTHGKPRSVLWLDCFRVSSFTEWGVLHTLDKRFVICLTIIRRPISWLICDVMGQHANVNVANLFFCLVQGMDIPVQELHPFVHAHVH